MCPIPRNIVGLRVPDIVWYWLGNIDQGFAIQWPVVAHRGPHVADVAPAVVMPERSGD